jgi:hypothetical protein
LLARLSVTTSTRPRPVRPLPIRLQRHQSPRLRLFSAFFLRLPSFAPTVRATCWQRLDLGMTTGGGGRDLLRVRLDVDHDAVEPEGDAEVHS